VPAYIRNGPVGFFDRSAGWPAGGIGPGESNKFYGYEAATGIVYASTDGGVSFARREPLGFPRTWDGMSAEGQPKAVFGRKETCGCRRRAVSTLDGLRRQLSPGSARLRALPGRVRHGGSRRLVPRHIRRWDSERAFTGIFRFRRYGASWVRINADAHQFACSAQSRATRGSTAAFTSAPRAAELCTEIKPQSRRA